MKAFSFLQQVRAACSYPGNMMRLTALSELNRLKSLSKTPTIHKNERYLGQKILLIALFQKGTLRSDIQDLLAAARAQGYYVLAVNNLKLKDPASMDAFCDTYVERYNFGRDFGSFQWGFQYIFDQDWSETCPRLLMVNDSVFFSAERVPTFLNDMMNSPIEALGATENYEINHHLGSFCIALANNVLRHKTFQTYWRKYRLSDVRPAVIKRGEMGLSKTLKRCVSSADQFQALYDSIRYATMLEDLNQEQLQKIIALLRRCQLTPARRFSLIKAMEEIEEELSLNFLGDVQIQIGTDALSGAAASRISIATLDELVNAVNSRLLEQDRIDPATLLDIVKSSLVDNFRQHSQIHQNSALLLHLGLPIVKLDCVYRGILNTLDVNTLLRLLPPDEGQDLKRLLYSRPFGGDVLVGWKRGAFLRGLI